MKKPFLFLTLLTLSLGINAQDFKEWVIYDVHGPVKDVSLQIKTFYLDKLYFHYLDEATFDNDGKKKDTVMQFDNEGYPIGWLIDTADCNVSYKITYNDNHQVKSTQMMSEFIGAGENDPNHLWNESRSFQYETNSFGLPEISSMNMLTNHDGKEYVTLYVYTDYVYDDKGNWISRNVEETEESAGNTENTLKREYLQTRKITYYD